MNNQSNNDRVIQFLCKPQGGRNYLLNALNSRSEKEFIDALHNVIDAMNEDYDLKISVNSDRKTSIFK